MTIEGFRPIYDECGCAVFQIITYSILSIIKKRIFVRRFFMTSHESVNSVSITFTNDEKQKFVVPSNASEHT